MSAYAFPQSRPGNSLPLRAKIVATSTALPNRVLTNEDIIERYHHRVAGKAIERMVGVRERRVAEKGVTDADLLKDAAVSCLAKAEMRADDLSKLIVTRFLGDRLLPMTAAHLQRRLDCNVAIQAYDISGGVHSFLEAIHTAAAAVEADNAPVLVVSGGIVNRMVSRTDPRLAFLFGDGAAAVLLAPSDCPKILSSYSFTNAEYADSAVAFCLRECASDTAYEHGNHDTFYNLYRQKDWKSSKDFILDAMSITVRTLLTNVEKEISDINLWLITENHYRLRQAIIERLEIPPEKTFSRLFELGNTMSAMLPILLNEAIESHKVSTGSLVMLLSVGEGIKGGGTLLYL